MYEYIIENKQTLETNVIFGRNATKAFERAKLNPNEWEVLNADYVD